MEDDLREGERRMEGPPGGGHGGPPGGHRVVSGGPRLLDLAIFVRRHVLLVGPPTSPRPLAYFTAGHAA